MRFSVILPYIVATATAVPAPVAPKSNNVARDDCEWTAWLLSTLPEVSPECIVSAIGDAAVADF
ncbi:hypothetical protein N7478_011524 [Penicillium angulare]|uniref:uncharacterized protein n=1 Tax=Penicillium angulare TaxID=116970 RepID=UPI00254115A9|nr:uncharacterized protein N7478_011524 [Penicillium angulare]KAJ5263919.1 hypothetical protein N7478_011524 [Penicillium angulare]